MLISAVQQHESAICIHIPPPSSPTPLGHHRAPSWAPCAIRHLPTSQQIYMAVYIHQCYSPNSSKPPLLPLCPHVCSLRLHLYSCPSNSQRMVKRCIWNENILKCQADSQSPALTWRVSDFGSKGYHLFTCPECTNLFLGKHLFPHHRQVVSMKDTKMKEKMFLLQRAQSPAGKDITCVLGHFSCVRLFVTPWTLCNPCGLFATPWSLPGSSVHGIL